MTIRRLMPVVAVLVAWGGCPEVLWAQISGAGPGSSIQESERDANRSGLSEDDRGSFEASTADEGLVGRNAENVSKMLRELRGSKRQQRSVDMAVENLNERRSSRNRRRSQQSPPPPIHVQFLPSFRQYQRPVALVASGVQARISRLLEQRDAGSVRVEMVDRTATLTGMVESEYEQRLLERMVRIEPGVSSVRNLIVVEGPAIAPGN